MTIDVFDPDFYFNIYPDLGDAGLTTDEELFDHFEFNGIDEGRLFSPLVDLNVYRASNPDLAAAGLTTNRQLLDHLETFGVEEGRIYSLVFDANYYRSLYADLQAASLDNEELFEHFLNNGIREGRVASRSFDVNFYLNNNADLRAAGFNNFQALEHFVVNGVKEGRQGSTGGNPAGGSTIAPATAELSTAVDLGNLSGTRNVSEFVGNADSIDIYRFILPSASNLNVSLSGLTADPDIEVIRDFNGDNVIDANEILGFSENEGTSNEAITLNSLAAGTYFVRVIQFEGDTNYNLALTATVI